MTNILNLKKNFSTDLGHSVIGIRCVWGPREPCHDWYILHVLIIYIDLILVLVSDWMAGGDLWLTSHNWNNMERNWNFGWNVCCIC